ncbi:hypothetical protein C8Q73DRAFT_712277 [Cubamyces lactineus]|nr:hypothetical protein C8Q73DRAFT_712277 [Cubamyces lactineus]
MADDQSTSTFGQCLLCPLDVSPGTNSENASQLFSIIDGSTPMGLAQLAWLQRAQLDFGITLDSTQNTLNLCVYHKVLLKAGAIVLCPPLRDLQCLIEHEQRDWQVRLKKCKTDDYVSGNVPSCTAPQDLSGYLSCIWQGSYHNYFDTLTGLIAYAPSYMSSEDYPPKLVLPPQLLCRNLGNRAPYLEFNCPGQTWRVNPYAVIVLAMKMLHAPYPPDDIFFCDYTKSDHVMYMENPLGKYEALLLELRTLYSRTDDLLSQCGRLIKGTVMERPQRDLGAPYHADWNRVDTRREDGFEEVQKQLLDVMSSHELERRCILCGTRKHVHVQRVGISFDGDRYDNPRQWLNALNIIPPDYDPLIDDFTNLMFVCEEHADAYDCGAWRWIPSSMEAYADVVPYATSKRTRSLSENAAIAAGDTSSSTTVDPSPTNTDNMTFDLLIFLPQAMPSIDLLGDLRSKTVVVPADAFQGDTFPRVLRSFRTLHLDPYITYASTLRMAGAAYLPFPDDDLKAIEDVCLRIHKTWNDRLRIQEAPVLCTALESRRQRDLEFIARKGW